MQSNRALLAFVLVTCAFVAAIALTSKTLVSGLRFGLEFRGGYEIYYVVSPANGAAIVSPDDMIKTVEVLQRRADTIGMAEPEIHIEGDSHIRVKLAGLTSADESRSTLGNPVGLPTKLTEKYTQTVGSVLGKTALKETMTAGAIGVGCIILLLLVLYRGFGAVAVICTLVYLWLLLIAFDATHATLSLSAVVAFVLGIGMAADASIICYERVREELARGFAPVDAVSRGFSASFSTIRDANFVTGLAMLALFVAGIGPIQGFSLTMLASIAISMATNFVLLRQLCIWLASSNRISRPLLIGSPKKDSPANQRQFDFVKWGRPALVASFVTIVAGGLYYRAHGLNLDIDFTSGTALDIDLDRAIDQDSATQIMTEGGTVPATVAIGGEKNDHIAARFDEILKPESLKSIIAAFQSHYTKVEYEENTADPGVAREFARRAVYAVIAAFLAIALYIGWRFSWSIAVATVLPIAHDVLLVSAIFSLFKLEIDVTYVAGLLTIIGYSLNDKIVIFGRIRENLELSDAGGNESLLDVVNHSVRQTLGRSIYTVLTVVMASACLYQFGCEPLQMFALAILLGLISGAYSSIFLSTMLWLAIRTARFQAQVTIALGTLATVAFVGWLVFPAEQPVESVKSLALASPVPAAGFPLGDLTPFIAITNDVIRIVETGQLAAAKARITDLESAWDQAEETMQPKSPNDWTAVDKSIDRSLAQLRSGQPEAAASMAALKTLLAKMQSLQPSGAHRQPLGNLAAYSLIADDILKLANSGDMIAAKHRAKDLESAWDEAEETMQPKSPSDWTAIDKAIDRVLSQVRSGAPEQSQCVSAAKTLVAKIESMR